MTSVIIRQRMNIFFRGIRKVTRNFIVTNAHIKQSPGRNWITTRRRSMVQKQNLTDNVSQFTTADIVTIIPRTKDMSGIMNVCVR